MAIWEYRADFLFGFYITVAVTVLSFACSFVFGTAITLFAQSRFVAVRGIYRLYVEIFRNIPPLVLLFFVFFGLPRIGLVMPSFICGVVAVTLYHASFVAEVVRGGLEAVPRGQVEAGRSLGLSRLHVFRLIVLPQAVWKVIPPLANVGISLFKTSALVSTIGVTDLMYFGQIVHERTFKTIEVFGFVGLCYVFTGMLMGLGAAKLQRIADRKAA